MGDAVVIGGLVLAIAIAVLLKARQSLRRDGGRPRGLAPGTGDHIIEVEYSSGLGGGHATQIRVPRDPQAYARRFVPLGKRPEGGTTIQDPPAAQAAHGPESEETREVGAAAASDRKKDEPE